MIKVRIFEEGNPKPIGIKDKEVAHIGTLIGYDDSELFFFDPSDCQIKKYNYL